jgi:hypothetical protein
MEKLNVYKDVEFDGPIIKNEMGKVFYLKFNFLIK